MCVTCGCSEDSQHVHPHEHESETDGAHPHTHTLSLEQRLLARNDEAAAVNRSRLEHAGVLALNLLGSPGAGKTTLIERTIRDIGPELDLSVIEGDQETELDAERIRASGAAVVQINTGTGCHLDAAMVARGLRHLALRPGGVVVIENVGNLVCPSLFDLGERAKVVVLSVTEGEEKPLKYPHAFRAASLLVLTKIDLLPHVSFNVDRCVGFARRINPKLEIVRTSSAGTDGLRPWYEWLRRLRAGVRDAHREPAGSVRGF